MMYPQPFNDSCILISSSCGNSIVFMASSICFNSNSSATLQQWVRIGLSFFCLAVNRSFLWFHKNSSLLGN
ncbi:MAG: hypothetical protein JJW01_02700 [Alphaproteobacteria bacterium]|nr:hypothetical protein [Rickettsiales bacterium]